MSKNLKLRKVSDGIWTDGHELFYFNFSGVFGTSNQITITDNGDGTITLSFPNDLIIPLTITIPNTGLHLLDTDASHDIIIKPGSNVSADRTVTLITGDVDRTLTLVDNPRSLFNGTFVEPFNALVTEAAGIITMSLEQAGGGGGDLTMNFSDGQTTFDCTPAATIVLTAGSDASPQENYIYILQSDKILTKSTSHWPTAEHIQVGFFFVPAATYISSDGAYINQNWNNMESGLNGRGHLAHISENLRLRNASYHSGITLTVTIGGGTTVDVAITVGVVYQLHTHITPVFDTASGDKLLVVNQHADNGGSYDAVTDLENLTDDAVSGSIANKYFNWVFWGVANKTGEYTPLMLNLPNGSYSRQAEAEADPKGYDVLTMPSAFVIESSTGFLIKRVTMRLSGGTWTEVSSIDLRGTTPGSVVGGVGSTPTEFVDNSFRINDEGDHTKEIAFQASGVATATTRTITMPDADVDLGFVPDQDVSATGNPTFDEVTLDEGHLIFPATKNASAGANTLDDYEKGTWTPDLQFGGAKVGITYSIQEGYYTIIGNMIYCSCRISLTSKGSSAGGASIEGFPVAVANNNAAANSPSLYLNGVSYANAFQATIPVNSDGMDFYEITEAGVITTLTDVNFADTSIIFLSAAYRI